MSSVSNSYAWHGPNEDDSKRTDGVQAIGKNECNVGTGSNRSSWQVSYRALISDSDSDSDSDFSGDAPEWVVPVA